MARGIGAEYHFGSPLNMTVRQESAWADLGIYTQVSHRYDDAECCTHCGWGIPVSGMGGSGENILTRRDVGGGVAGATSDALSRGGSAGAARPGGGRKEETGGEKKVRLGLVGIGVPSSSSRTCGEKRGGGERP